MNSLELGHDLKVVRSTTIKKMLDKRRSWSLPAAVLIASLALELVGREDCEDALL